MKKLIAGTTLALILLAPSLSFAQTSVSTQTSASISANADLQAQYQSLLRQLIVLLTQRLTALQAQLAAQTATQSGTVSGSTSGSTSSSNTASVRANAKVAATTVPLLAGGTTKAGATVPVAYLELQNAGPDAVHVTGFQLQQNGTASTDAVVGLSTVDDKGGSRANSEVSPFNSDNAAYVPTDATIAPGTLKLFTIKATLGSIVTLGSTLKLDVTNIETNGDVTANYPLRGTTWTIGL